MYFPSGKVSNSHIFFADSSFPSFLSNWFRLVPFTFIKSYYPEGNVIGFVFAVSSFSVSTSLVISTSPFELIFVTANNLVQDVP